MNTLVLPSGSGLTNLPIYEQVVYGYLARCTVLDTTSPDAVVLDT